MIYIEDFTEMTINTLEKVRKSNTDITHKISFISNIRRDSQGNYRIQERCNEILTELYDEKYEILKLSK